VQRINRTISLIAPEKLREAGLPLRQIKVLVISPSQPHRAHGRSPRTRAAMDGALSSAEHRRNEPQRIEPRELSALRERVLPGR